MKTMLMRMKCKCVYGFFAEVLTNESDVSIYAIWH